MKALTLRRARSGGRTPVRGEIERMARRIVECFDPEKIILFGSHARGAVRPDSDVDLLVVMHCAGSKTRVQSAIRVALADFPIAKDIIVVTPEEFEWRSRVPGTVERPAALEGEILHARR